MEFFDVCFAVFYAKFYSVFEFSYTCVAIFFKHNQPRYVQVKFRMYSSTLHNQSFNSESRHRSFLKNFLLLQFQSKIIFLKIQSLIPDSNLKQHTVPQIFAQPPSSLSLILQLNRYTVVRKISKKKITWSLRIAAPSPAEY